MNLKDVVIDNLFFKVPYRCLKEFQYREQRGRVASLKYFFIVYYRNKQCFFFSLRVIPISLKRSRFIANNESNFLFYKLKKDWDTGQGCSILKIIKLLYPIVNNIDLEGIR